VALGFRTNQQLRHFSCGWRELRHCNYVRTRALGLRLGSVAITDNASGSPQSIALQGTGVASFVSLSATTLSFGNQS